MNILEEFWNGNIEPTDYEAHSNKEYQELLRLIICNEDALMASMTEDQKALFIKYTGDVRKQQMLSDCLLFQNSFKLGCRMMLEVLKE